MPLWQDPRIDLIFFDAGGGHRASATALKSVLDRWRPSWQVRLINLRDVLEPIDIIRRIARVRIEDLYNRMLLQRGLTLGTGSMLRATQMLIRRLHRKETSLLAGFWKSQPPDLVASLIPNFNRAIFGGLRTADAALGRPPTPMVTILTDLADYPPHFWIERQGQYFICGTDEAAEQACAMAHPSYNVFRTSGMIVRSEFYERPDFCQEAEKMALGLRPKLPTGLVSFGGYGSRKMLTIARRVAEAGLRTQLIFLCGHNQKLGERLRRMNLPFPAHIEGFTGDMPRFMRIADYFIGKPGPGSISEALVMGLPVVVERNRWTMVQERFNTDWILSNGFGVVLHSFAEIATGILPMLEPERLAAFREHIRTVENRAVFEIPEILAALLVRDRRPALALEAQNFESADRAPGRAA
jgi:hypothetical protein